MNASEGIMCRQVVVIG